MGKGVKEEGRGPLGKEGGTPETGPLQNRGTAFRPADSKIAGPTEGGRRDDR